MGCTTQNESSFAILSGFDFGDTPGIGTFYEFLTISISKGLIDTSNLSVDGDGTPVATSARERRHRMCKCSENGMTDCDCDRYFSQPDCDIGWDSSRDCFYSGYDLYMLVAGNLLPFQSLFA